MADETTDTTTEAATETEASTEAVVDASTETVASTEDAGDGTILGGEGEAAATEEATKVEPPEKYELTAPEGITIDEESLALADPVFRELGLDNDAANKLMPVAAEFAKKAGATAIAQHEIQSAQAFTAMTREWAENAKGDAEIGGAKWDETVDLSSKALDMLGFPKGSEFRKALNESGFGNHPEFIRAFRRIGERVSEDAFLRGDAKPGAKKTDADILYPNMTKSGE